MRLRDADPGDGAEPLRRAPPQLAPQVGPLVFELPRGRRDAPRGALAGDLRRLEGVAGSRGFVGHGLEVARDAGDWIVLRPKARELGMRTVAASAAAQDLLRQQAFAP